MVKKNLVNKNVVRALSIGLSLAMASQPLTAMAAGETSDTPTTDPVEGSPVAGPADDAKEEKPATQAAEVMGELVDFNDTIMPVQSAIKETNDAIDAVNAANAQAPFQIELGVNKEAADLAWEADSNFNHISDVAEKDLGLIGDVAGATIQDGIKDGLEPQVEEKLKARNNALTNDDKTGVNDIVDKADALLDGTEETLTQAEAQIETSRTALANAGTPGEANAAYAAAQQKVSEANTAVETTKTELAQLESDYAEAETAFNDADTEYSTLKTLYDNAYTAYINYKNAAGTDAKNLDSELDRLEKEANDLYNAANAAKGRADAAKDRADKAKKAAEAAKKTLEEQKAELQKNKYAELKALEDKLNARVDNNVELTTIIGTVELGKEDDPEFGDKTGVQKGTYDEYFDKVVELYYIPEVVKGEFVSLKWDKNNNNNDKYNYCEVTYKTKDEKGKTVTKTVLLNYKLSEKNDKHEFGGLVIFEKTEHFYFNQDELTEAERAEIDEKGAIDKGNYVVRKNSLGEYVAFTDKNDPWAIKDAKYRDFFGNDVEVDVDEESTEVTWNYFNGILTRTVKADVTTTTYTDKTLDSMSAKTSTLEDESAAKQAFVDALNNKINALKAGQTLLITVGDEEIEVAKGTVVTLETAAQYGYVGTTDPTKTRHVEDWQEETVGYKVSGVYSTYFTDTVTIFDDGFKKQSDAEYWANYTYDNFDASYVEEHNWRKNTGWFNLGLIGGYYYGERTIGQEANDDLTVSGYDVDESWFPHIYHDYKTYYQYSGTYTVNYEKYTSMQTDYYELFKVFNVHTKEEAIEGVKQKIAENGGIYIGTVNHDMNPGKLTILYTPAAGRVTDVEIMETDTTKLADELKKTISGNVGRVQITGMTAIINRVDKGTDTPYTTYGYAALNYVLKTVVEEEMKTISTTTWNKHFDRSTTATTTYENDNWYSGDISFATTYKHGEADYKTDANSDSEKKFDYKQQKLVMDYRNALAKQQAKIDAKDREISAKQNVIDKHDAESKRQAKLSELYARISKEAKQAEKAADKAEKRIAEIKKMIDDLDTSRHDFEAELIEKKAWLADAQQRLEDAIKRRDDLLTALGELTIPTFGGGGGEETGGETGGAPGAVVLPPTEVLGTPVLAAGPLVFAPGAVVAPGAEAADDTTTITNGQAALAATVPEDAADTAYEQLPEQKAPLAAAPINEETLSWWWLLIIAVLGGAGYAMYKKFQTKKDEKTTN